MGKHLILTVHGIGEQQPGETVDAVVGAATTWYNGNPQPPTVLERDMIELGEETFDGDPNRNAKLYETHFRRLKNLNDPTDEALFVEAYWADLSPAPKGPIRTILDLIWVVLALGYLALDNVEQTKGDGFAARVVHGFTWTFFGGLAPVNAYFALGSLPLLANSIKLEFFGTDLWFFLGLSLCFLGGAAFGFRQQGKVKTYMKRLFWRGMVLFGVLLWVVLLLSPLGIGLWELPYGDPLDQVVSAQIFVLEAVFVVTLAFTITAYLSSLGNQPKRDSLTGNRIIYPDICSAMLVLWTFFLAGLWLAVASSANSIEFFRNGKLNQVLDADLKRAITTLDVVFVSVAALVVVGLVLFVLRKAFSKGLYKRHPIISRAILNAPVQIVFALSGLALLLVSIRTFGERYLDNDVLCEIPKGLGDGPVKCSALGHALNFLAAYHGVIAFCVLGAFILIYRFPNVASAGLGVARDIVTYAIRKRCTLGTKDFANQAKNYPNRKAINERFYRTLYYALQIFDADHVTIVSHSQGTIIATQMLGAKKVQNRIAGRPVTLITMGAPVTHVYQRYFPKMFTVDPDALKAEWVNIFREDDFVGTRIEDDLIPEERNLSVSPGGHTGYFTDHEVWGHLWSPKVGFDVFNPKPPI